MADQPSHWVKWHSQYDDDTSSLSRRLAVVQERLAKALDDAPPGGIRLASICAGEGRDVTGVLAVHPRGRDVDGLLVEKDRALVTSARSRLRDAGVSAVEVVRADASVTDVYEAIVPVDIALVCGVFGNIEASDIKSTIFELPNLCASDATVIWTRHHRAPDLTPSIRRWFEEAGFTELSFDTCEPFSFGVGTHRLSIPPGSFRPGTKMFDFVGTGEEARC